MRIKSSLSALAKPSAALIALLLSTGLAQATDDVAVPERVTFPSADGKTRLIGYLHKPAGTANARRPAVVMMHGRSGAYSERAEGVYDASTLAARHKAWGRNWAEAGYVAILVDGFGPRGYPHGFPRNSYDERPPEVSEVTVRPLDAYGALAFLRARPEVIPDQIGLMGWSNGGSAALSAMSDDAPGIKSAAPHKGFRAALAFYPACKLKGRFEDAAFRPYAPVLILSGTADEEVSYTRCVSLVEESREAGGSVEIALFEDATHGFDAPTRKRQSIKANRFAAADATAAAMEFFARHLKAED